MKKKLVLIPVVVLICGAAWASSPPASDQEVDAAFVGEKGQPSDGIVILGSKDIQSLEDQKLVDAYLDALVEIQASNVFHATSGFTPKEYAKYKALLKYRYELLIEIHRRKMELPADVK